MLGVSVYEALRHAIAQTRSDKEPVQLTAPATGENVLRALQ
jgi:xanthine dehydrogenase large subunit